MNQRNSRCARDGLGPTTLYQSSFYLANSRWHLFAIRCSQIQILAYAGVGLYVFSGIVFGWLPIFEFRKKGRVKKGKSYIHTTRLVNTGIYSIVRHPQYVTLILWAIADMLLFQHQIIILLCIPIIPLTYIDLIKADKDAIENFGDYYKAYTKEVPRANFLLGVIKYLQHRKKILSSLFMKLDLSL